jgi:hypothetical protein
VWVQPIDLSRRPLAAFGRMNAYRSELSERKARARGNSLLPLLGALLLFSCGGSALPSCDNDAGGSPGTFCGFSNPEDLALAEDAGLVLVSEIRLPYAPGGGSIAAFPAAGSDGPPVLRRLWPDPEDPQSAGGIGEPSCTEPPDPAAFRPHGISVVPLGAGLARVAAVTHGEAERIDLFDLQGRGDEALLRWRGCVPMPEETSGNDVVAAVDGSLLVSNFQPTFSGLAGLYYMSKASFGLATGDLRRWRPDGGWEVVPDSRAANPNGVAEAPDRGWIFYAETGAARVVRLSVDDGGVLAATVPGAPDNLSWAPDGRLLVATHLAGPSLMACMVGRLPCRTAWEVWAVDPEDMSSRRVFGHDGSAVGGVATAQVVGGRIYFAPIFGDRIGVAAWPRPEARD